MKKLLLILLGIVLLTVSCKKEEEEILLPKFEMTLDGETFDPSERYSVITTFAGEKWVDQKLKRYLFCIFK